MKPSPTIEVREMYDATADSYAKMMDTEIGLPVYADVLQRLQARIADTPGTLMDTACGSGHMLSMYHDQFDPQRALVGVDLSPRMVSLAQQRLGSHARVVVGDMRNLNEFEAGSAAAVINWYAIHHLGVGDVLEALSEWHRVLVPGGQLLIAAWEGNGDIDYGEEANIVALRYSSGELSAWAEDAGFLVSRCVVDPVEDFPMDAVYLEGVKHS